MKHSKSNLITSLKKLFLGLSLVYFLIPSITLAQSPNTEILGKSSFLISDDSLYENERKYGMDMFERKAQLDKKKEQKEAQKKKEDSIKAVQLVISQSRNARKQRVEVIQTLGGIVMLCIVIYIITQFLILVYRLFIPKTKDSRPLHILLYNTTKNILLLPVKLTTSLKKVNSINLSSTLSNIKRNYKTLDSCYNYIYSKKRRIIIFYLTVLFVSLKIGNSMGLYFKTVDPMLKIGYYNHFRHEAQAQAYIENEYLEHDWDQLGQTFIFNYNARNITLFLLLSCIIALHFKYKQKKD